MVKYACSSTKLEEADGAGVVERSIHVRWVTNAVRPSRVLRHLVDGHRGCAKAVQGADGAFTHDSAFIILVADLRFGSTERVEVWFKKDFLDAGEHLLGCRLNDSRPGCHVRAPELLEFGAVIGNESEIVGDRLVP